MHGIKRPLKRNGCRFGFTLRYCKKKLGHARLVTKYKRYMRLSTSEKYEIIQQVTRSELGVNEHLMNLEYHEVRFTNGIKIILKYVLRD